MSQNKSRENLWAGIMGSAATLTSGGKAASGNIAFTSQPANADSFTIGATTFSFYTSGSEPGLDTSIEITIAGTLALTLAAAETKVEAHAVAGTAGRVLINVDVTNIDADLSFTAYPGVTPALVSSTNTANTADTVFTGAVSTPSVDVEDVQKSQVALEWLDDGTSAAYVTLNDGQEGQEVMIYHVSEATAGDSVVFIGSFGGANNLATIAAAGDYSNLRFISGAWRETYNDGTNGVTLSASFAVAL